MEVGQTLDVDSFLEYLDPVQKVETMSSNGDQLCWSVLSWEYVTVVG